MRKTIGILLFVVAHGVACAKHVELVPNITPAPAVAPSTNAQAPYPPTAIQLFLAPQPVPAEVRGFHFIAEFDVDSLGRSTLVAMTHTPNARYNARLQSELQRIRFRPATTPSGSPIRARGRIVHDF